MNRNIFLFLIWERNINMMAIPLCCKSLLYLSYTTLLLRECTLDWWICNLQSAHTTPGLQVSK